MIEITKDLSNSRTLLILLLLLVSTLVLISVGTSAFPTSFVYAKDKVKQQHGAQSPTSSSSSSSSSYTASPSCITYDPSARLITISCQSAHFSDVYNQVNNREVLDRQPQGLWLLNANVTINKGSTLDIDPTDTNWLKIIADGTTAYGIHVYGSLKINSVKLTSWDPHTNYYALSHGSRETFGKITHNGTPRPYIRVESGATGTTNITNSQIAYLGYEGGWGSGTSGIHYNAGDGSVIRNNDISHLYFGFYSKNVRNIAVENNTIHDSGHYGIDPHTGTHDMIIRNNTVYGNNGTAIICSLDCYNILVEHNVVYNNTGSGIAFTRNVTHSVIRSNYVHEQGAAIQVSRSTNDEIYNNTISNVQSGIGIINGSFDNEIHHNNIINASNPLRTDTDASKNKVYSNNIVGSNSSSVITSTTRGLDSADNSN
jgi:poly(beta-D-mannuronate) C5 epimerase